jgi:hypothetical protein
MKKHVKNFQMETKATDKQIENWKILDDLYENNPLPTYDMLNNLGLFMKTSELAKILFLDELYQHIVNIPGVILEFGIWWGQNLTTFENLRAIYEPFNKNRRIIGFDTFSGYASFSKSDKKNNVIKPGNYGVPRRYKSYLEKIIAFHESNNVLGNLKKHELIEGNVVKTVPKYFKSNPETIVALAYFDLALYKPTKIALETIKPHLIPGSVIMFDELNEPEYPGETIAFKEVLKDLDFSIKKSKFIADRSIVIIK